jgi:DNA-binding MarR family transcriptional regulator
MQYGSDARAGAIEASLNPAACNCLALRQATRQVTRFYDRHLAPYGLRVTQYSILARIDRHGGATVNALAAALVMDRTTLGRNILPLQRDGLLAVRPGREDRRVKEMHLTRSGEDRLRAARKGWREAQRDFEREFGVERASALRVLLHDVSAELHGDGDSE